MVQPVPCTRSQLPDLPTHLATLYLPTSLPRPLQALFKSTVQLVLLPTVLGLLANEYFKKQVGVWVLQKGEEQCGAGEVGWWWGCAGGVYECRALRTW